MAVEESKVYLTELNVQLNEAEILTFGKMIHYLEEKQNNLDILFRPNIELIHIFVIKEDVLKD